MPFERMEDGKLRMDAIKLEILIDTLICKAKDLDELEWVYVNVSQCLELFYEDRLEELEND